MLPHNMSIEEMMSSQTKQVEWLKFLTDNGGTLMGQKYVNNYSGQKLKFFIFAFLALRSLTLLSSLSIYYVSLPSLSLSYCALLYPWQSIHPLLMGLPFGCFLFGFSTSTL